MEYTAKVTANSSLVVTGGEIGLLQFINDNDTHKSKTHGLVIVRTKSKLPVGIVTIECVRSCDICEDGIGFTHVGFKNVGTVKSEHIENYCIECYLKSMIERYGELKLELIFTPCCAPQNYWKKPIDCEDCTSYDCFTRRCRYDVGFK